jgi:hypothetical protein
MISAKFISQFGKGFSAQNIWNMMLFYQKFSAVQRDLSRTHYKILLRVENPIACIWCMNEPEVQSLFSHHTYGNLAHAHRTYISTGRFCRLVIFNLKETPWKCFSG